MVWFKLDFNVREKNPKQSVGMLLSRGRARWSVVRQIKAEVAGIMRCHRPRLLYAGIDHFLVEGSTSCPPLPVCSGNLELCFLRAAGSSNASQLTYITRKNPQLTKQLLTRCPRASSNHELQLQVGHVPDVKSERGNYRGAILLLSLIHQTNKTTVYNTHTAQKSNDWLEPN